MLNRRQFLAAAVSTVSMLRTQMVVSPEWGGPILDIHSHLRQGLDANVTHMDGCGVTHAVLLARSSASEQVKAIQAKYPKRFEWAASADITRPEAADLLTKAVKDGAIGLGEIKFRVEADGPELRRMYALAAELNVPILVHFQEVPHFEGEGVFSAGFKRFEAMLKAYPKTKFIGHADAFWANLSADYANEAAYPAGPIKRGGITDKLLADYPNLFGDLSANSGNNALSRDPEFTADFLARQQNKLLFGSDCFCQDGKGGGVSQANNPAAARLRGKCVARETLAILKQHTQAAAFKKMTWENTHQVFKLRF
ncbi:MAG TPA: amidohydrolase family protein [Blastocatellia bacterium]|nr:amidohydrolase family protein [Blastocatellia bacterium]